MLVDSHCHLDSERFAGDLQSVIERAGEAGVEKILSIGTGDGPPGLDCAIHVADQYPHVFATVGVHPHDAAKCSAATFDELRSYARHPKVVGFGEIGLDYHYDFSPRETQREVFAKQLKLASELRLPVIIHTREAWNDTMAMLRDAAHHSGIMHCFTGDAEQAREALALGFHLSFGGVLTFRTAEAVREAAALVPDDRLLLETDAPYLAPVPHRGKRNEPSFMLETAKKLAEIRNTSLEQIAVLTTANFERLCLHPKKPNDYTGVSNGH